MAFSHGGNDAQKTMGIMALALITFRHHGMALTVGKDLPIPLWIQLTAATAMGCGTAVGGWRIIKTMGHKLAKIQPIHGFAAETGAATIIEIASWLGSPLSTTHVIGSAILGAGTSRGFSTIRWNIAGTIVTAWMLTLPLCMTLAAVFYNLIMGLTALSHMLFHAS